MIAAYTRTKISAELHKARINELMQRKSANGWISKHGKARPGWDSAKKAKMVRRYMTANKTIDEATSAIQQLGERLVQLST